LVLLYSIAILLPNHFLTKFSELLLLPLIDPECYLAVFPHCGPFFPVPGLYVRTTRAVHSHAPQYTRPPEKDTFLIVNSSINSYSPKFGNMSINNRFSPLQVNDDMENHQDLDSKNGWELDQEDIDVPSDMETASSSSKSDSTGSSSDAC
jgi:hypothetical protein